MNNLQKIFAGGRKALIVFECAGAPDLQESSLRIKTMLDAGADIVELALPFSDPIADGAAAQAAYLAALNNVVTTADIIGMCRNIRKSFPEAGLVISGYCNVFMQYGYEKIFSELAEIKADAVRILDLPFEEYPEIAPYLEKHGLALAISVGKNSTAERIRQLLTQSTALIYCGRARHSRAPRRCAAHREPPDAARDQPGQALRQPGHPRGRPAEAFRRPGPQAGGR